MGGQPSRDRRLHVLGCRTMMFGRVLVMLVCPNGYDVERVVRIEPGGGMPTVRAESGTAGESCDV